MQHWYRVPCIQYPSSILTWIFLCIMSPLTLNAQSFSELGLIFGEQDVYRYEEGSKIYLDLLHEALQPPLSEDLIQHLEFLSLILPETGPARSALSALQDESGHAEDMETLIRWWHRQDPVPATFVNERIIEHLSRIYFALNNYEHKRSDLGVDDRGKILIRLGWPDTLREVKLRNSGLYLRPVEYTLPRNEFWVYRRIHKDAHYFFVYQSRRRGYKTGSVTDLIPNRFRTRQEDAPVLLKWLDEIYQQLSTEHEHYGPLFDAVSNYVSIASSDETSPFYFTKQILRDAQVQHNFHRRSRSQRVPISATEAGRSPVPIAPCVRWARFLEEEGTTRLNISWSVTPKQLQPKRRALRRFRRNGAEPSDDFLLTAYLITRDKDFAPSNLRLRQYHLDEGPNSSFSPRTWTSPGLRETINLALQWEHAWTQVNSLGNRMPSTKLGTFVQTLDSIPPLNAGGQVLEMSDLLLTQLDAQGDPDTRSPMVATHWRPSDPLGLYFEVYFLRFNDEEQTDYTVTYEIQNVDGSGDPTISASTSLSSESTTAKERIVLDLSAWQESRPVAITVRITDNTSGAMIERSTMLQLNTKHQSCEPANPESDPVG